MTKLEELVAGLRELERDLDGVCDEMTFSEIDNHSQAAYCLALAEEILREDPR
ncbi:hypothetical protein [Micromonospora sp. CB01531]|uniref:hypothetical protein n=1 Tax=Micromonospora sp. CB01531 TaxID=1718947 RepID=UPI000A5C438B|nr:hypothetical protein [Micromonospora sp. CB01531]